MGSGWKKAWDRFVDVVDDFLAYIMTMAGILASNYIPLLKTGGMIDIKLGWGRIVLAAIVALLVVGKQEYIPNKGDTAVAARAGRKSNFIMRMANALAQGMMWSQIVQLAI
jgi:hypothetical protein